MEDNITLLRKYKRNKIKMFKKISDFGGTLTRTQHRSKSRKKVLLRPSNKLAVGPCILEDPVLGIPIFPLTHVAAILKDSAPSLFFGDKPTDSDILRCNHRILSNFGLSSDGKLRSLIANLGVVSGESRRDLEKKIEELKSLDLKRMEGQEEQLKLS